MISQQLAGMLKTVASALGDDIRREVVFVGGCTIALFITDTFTLQSIRSTQDVDLICDLAGYADWNRLQESLKERGFTIPMDEGVICRMHYGPLIVDFMPDDERILGFSNRWYRRGIETAPKTLFRVLWAASPERTHERPLCLTIATSPFKLFTACYSRFHDARACDCFKSVGDIQLAGQHVMGIENIKAKASSRTLRKVNRRLAEAIGVELNHTRYPSDDFEDTLEKLSRSTDKKALQYFKQGLIAGLTNAGDFLVDKTIRKNGRYWEVDPVVTVHAEITLPSGKKRAVHIDVAAEKFGFF